MSEKNETLAAIELQIKQLPWRQRLGFMLRQVTHAVVNVGPEVTREQSTGLYAYISTVQHQINRVALDVPREVQTLTLWQRLIDKVNECLDKTKNALLQFNEDRASHWVGKIGILVLLTITTLGFVKFCAS